MSRSPGNLAESQEQRRRNALAESMSRVVRSVVMSAIERLGSDNQAAGQDANRRALTVERAAQPLAPARLAFAHLANTRARDQARELYERCLARYREQVPSPYAAENLDDAGAAVACFVAANMEALKGIHATPEMLLTLQRQLGGVAQMSSAWHGADLRERQFYFEQMAILSVLISESAAQAALQGAAAMANVQRAARGYLKELLGLNADHLTLGAKGLSMVSVSHAA